MNATIQGLLNGTSGNYIFPFFWQHGEEESVLREYMAAIEGCGIRAVCVESRPHPDFCGERWWHDMDIILDEARRRGMKVWILDDSHFPTGYANGAMSRADGRLARRSILCRRIPCGAPGSVTVVGKETLARAAEWKPSQAEKFLLKPEQLAPRGTDELLAVTAQRRENGIVTETVDLTKQAESGEIRFTVPETGEWALCICHATCNCGPHRDYINMMDRASCRVLIDAVYEPHFARYGADFGTVIAGFFSDEPELGNGHLYEQGKHLYEMDDLPWSRELHRALKVLWGDAFAQNLTLLGEPDRMQLRVDFMENVTRLVEQDFSMQLGDWCRAHGVEYVGHVIEDNGQHARTGTSLGHYFRGLAGQDMAGIDDIGGQVFPGGEYTCPGNFGSVRIGEFFHYVLGKLGSSAASIEPRKHGRAMCEIFGNYGWAEGVRLEKYLVDHFLVRGINRFVPHAFDPAPFPDPDCPPHFYAHGHNPQYRHFGSLMRYTNRMCELMSGGHPVVPAAILYMGEAEWAGEFMPMHVPAKALCDAQIDYEILPADVFSQPEAFGTEFGRTLRVHTQEYRVLIVPQTEYLCEAAAAGIARLLAAGMPVLFVGSLPQTVAGETQEPFDAPSCRVVPVEQLAGTVREMRLTDVRIAPGNNRIRYRRYRGGSEFWMFVNEGETVYRGSAVLPVSGSAYVYNAWDNRVEALSAHPAPDGGTEITLELEPRKSLLVVFDEPGVAPETSLAVRAAHCRREELSDGWVRSVCESAQYPAFEDAKAVTLPDKLASEQPEFSGFACYERTLALESVPSELLLEITDAYEGVELFVNGVSAGIQIVPVFRYDITGLVHPGENRLRIEVATTLERKMAACPEAAPRFGGSKMPPSCPSGINGTVVLLTGRD